MKKLIIFLISLSLFNPIFANIDFDGTDDLVSCGDWAAVQNMATLTVAIWVYPHTVDTNYRVVVTKLDDTNSKGWSLVVTDAWNSSQPQCFYLSRFTDGNTQASWSPDNTLDNNEWNCLIASVPAVGSVIQLYHGSESSAFASLAEQDSLGGAPDAGSGSIEDDSGVNLMIADDHDQTAVQFDGIIGSVCIWDTALTARQAEQYFRMQSEIMPMMIASSNLQVYYTLDDEESGSSCDGDTFRNYKTPGTGDGTGDDGAGNTGLTAVGEDYLSYP